MTTGEGVMTPAEDVLASAEDLRASAGAPENDAERNAVFESLVTGDADIVGLVAYSIYKQNKHDWLISFAKAKGREPNEIELGAYIVGESTPRRLATYRHLAEATLEGRGPEVPTGAGGVADTSRNYAIAARHRPVAQANAGGTSGTIIAFVALVVVGLVAVYLAARYGLPGVSR